MDEKVYVNPEQGVSNPITFNPESCSGCNRCIEVCQVDIFIPNPEKNKPPIVAYPGECWYCGSCVMECPQQSAIQLNPLSMNQVYWKPKGKNER